MNASLTTTNLPRSVMATALAVVTMVLLVLAASSGPIRLWSIDLSGPSSIDGGIAPGATLASRQPEQVDLSNPQPGSMTWLWLVGLPIVALAVAAAFDVRPSVGWLKRSRAGARRGWARPQVPLPEVWGDERILTIDVEAARAALVTGTPRNAIVACWVQLERDADAAGLPRADAETAAEYVERLVAAASVDPAPIGQLATLYREARFSGHELNDDHRARAIVALDRVVDVLRRVQVPA